MNERALGLFLWLTLASASVRRPGTEEQQTLTVQVPGYAPTEVLFNF